MTLPTALRAPVLFGLLAPLAMPAAAFAQDRTRFDDAPIAPAAPTVLAQNASGELELDDDAPMQVRIPPKRYAYAGAGLFLIGGLGMSYWAQGQTLRAGSITSARDHQRILDNARTSAATANMLYAMAGLTLAYGVVLEFLPEPVAVKADLTFHF